MNKRFIISGILLWSSAHAQVPTTRVSLTNETVIAKYLTEDKALKTLLNQQTSAEGEAEVRQCREDLLTTAYAMEVGSISADDSVLIVDPRSGAMPLWVSQIASKASCLGNVPERIKTELNGRGVNLINSPADFAPAFQNHSAAILPEARLAEFASSVRQNGKIISVGTNAVRLLVKTSNGLEERSRILRNTGTMARTAPPAATNILPPAEPVRNANQQNQP